MSATAPRPRPGGPLPADQAARDLITRSGLDRTLFVDAGAGSGKTTQLVGRVTSLVLAGVSLSGIAAITFTEAAAAELRDRIRVELERLAADVKRSEADRQRARAALVDADQAAITTLHGFAKRVLAEHPTSAGLPPSVDVLDEITSQLEAEARWARFVDQLYAGTEHEELVLRAHMVGVELEPRYPGHSTMKDVAAALADNWDRLDPLVGRRHGPLDPIDVRPFVEAVDAFAGLASQCQDPTDKFYVQLTEVLLPEMRAMAVPNDPLRTLGNLQACKGGWRPGGAIGSDKNWPGTAKGARARVQDVNAAVTEVLGAVADDVLQRLLTLVAVEVLTAARARQASGALEFHDLLVLARELLRTDDDARRRLHERYTHLLLDEFQDTDPIQIELAVLIAASVEDAASQERTASSWIDVVVPEGRLFFVGDPKQSIYRFRRADIGLFLDARDRFGRDDALVELTTNFRTVGRIVEWVNQLFGVLMAGEVPRTQPAHQALVAHRPPGDEDRRPVVLGGPHDTARAGELRAAEAADVAATIAHIRAYPEAWPVGDPGETRPAALSDITVLVPTRTSLPQLRDALDRLDIAYRLATGTLVYDTQEVRDLLAVVRAVDDPTDQLSLVAALRSPLYACSDRDLFRWKAAGGQWDLTRSAPGGAVVAVTAAMTHLRSLWAERWWMSPASLLERIASDRRADLLAFGERNPADVWRRLRFLIDQARAFEDSGGSGLRAYVAWAELQGADGANVHEPVLPESDDDAVRIMTVHGSKGLEFPITIVSGLTTRPGGNRSGIKMLWGDDGLPSLSMRKGVTTANHDPRLDLEAEMDEHEKRRLLYVACTRAKDHLVVSGHHVPQPSDDRRTFAELIWNHMGEHTASRAATWLGVEHPAPRLPSDLESVEGPDAATWDEQRVEVDAAFARLAHPVASVASATAIARAVATPDHLGSADAAAAATADGPDEDADVDARRLGDGTAGPVQAPLHRQGRKGRAVGNAVHAVLEYVDFNEPSDLDRLVERATADEQIPELGSLVRELAESALASPAVALAAAHPHHKEVFVAAPVGERVIEGYVDLLVETPAGLVVIDYKTDTVSDAELDEKLARYELQGAAYAVALERITGLTVVECRFVFCRRHGAIERSVVDLRAAKDRVHAHLVR